jgi:diadenylate cyclase
MVQEEKEDNSLEEEDFEEDSKKDDKYYEKEEFIGILKIFSPGTAMRTALDDILRARMGALIAVQEEGLSSIVDGGFKVNCKFSAQRLVELAKMDGAIILSKDLKTILNANTLLTPKGSLRTSETGTRHKAAERTAKQFGTIVVAVSERKNKITLYWKDYKHVLENSSEILRRATETLQILEKQKEVFDDLLSHLNVLEITDLVSTSDVCNVLQRIEIIRRITESVKRYLVELGKEGIIVSMRLKELTKNISVERDAILGDYFLDYADRVNSLLEEVNFDFLLEISNIMRMVFEELHDKAIYTRGYRILRKTGFLEKDLDLLSNNLKTLGKIFDSQKEDFEAILGVKPLAEALVKELESLKGKILEGKKI